MNDLSKTSHLQQSENQEMKDMPLVSVSMPVFNSERYIAEAIESILAQTYTNFELVTVLARLLINLLINESLKCIQIRTAV